MSDTGTAGHHVMDGGGEQRGLKGRGMGPPAMCSARRRGEVSGALRGGKNGTASHPILPHPWSGFSRGDSTRSLAARSPCGVAGSL